MLIIETIAYELFRGNLRLVTSFFFFFSFVQHGGALLSLKTRYKDDLCAEMVTGEKLCFV